MGMTACLRAPSCGNKVGAHLLFSRDLLHAMEKESNPGLFVACRNCFPETIEGSKHQCISLISDSFFDDFLTDSLHMKKSLFALAIFGAFTASAAQTTENSTTTEHNTTNNNAHNKKPVNEQ